MNLLLFLIEREVIPTSPCVPSPCGANAECRVIDNRPVCSCLQGMLGAPPNCRPECVINQDCPPHLACTNNKCKSPCLGSCGYNAECTVHNHSPKCVCLRGFEGDPFAGCNPVKGKCRIGFMECFHTSHGAYYFMSVFTMFYMLSFTS